MAGIDPISNIAAAVEAGTSLVSTVINKIWPNPDDEAKANIAELSAAYDNAMKLINAQVAVITAEAKGEGILQRNWRPLTMLTFLALIAGWFLGFQAPNVTPDLVAQLFDLIKIGLGGYVVGRSFEKTMPSIIDAIKAMKK